MNIPGHSPIRLLENYLLGVKKAQAESVSSGDGSAKGSPHDKVKISVNAGEINRIHKVAASSPEVRAERVAEIRERIESGIYNVRGEDVGEKLLESALFDKIL